MAKVTLMTQAAYADHRGVSRVAVHKAIKQNRISLIDGKIDPAVADIQWASNTRARAPASSKAAQTRAVDAATPPPAGGPVGEAEAEDYLRSRARREAAEADLAEIRLAETRGDLIRLDAVQSALGTALATAREALLQIPARMAPLLAAEADPATVQNLLHAEIHRALVDLSGTSGRLGQAAAEVQ